MCAIAYGSMGERRVGDGRRLTGVSTVRFGGVVLVTAGCWFVFALLLSFPTRAGGHPFERSADGALRATGGGGESRDRRTRGAGRGGGGEGGEEESWWKTKRGGEQTKRSLLMQGPGDRRYLSSKPGKNGSKTIVIFANGTVTLADSLAPRFGLVLVSPLIERETMPTILAPKAHGGQGHRAFVSIQGFHSKMYLCMGLEKGRLYGSKDLKQDECKFNETILSNNYLTYCRDFDNASRASGGWCMCVNKSGALRPGSRCNKADHKSQFLNRPENSPDPISLVTQASGTSPRKPVRKHRRKGSRRNGRRRKGRRKQRRKNERKRGRRRKQEGGSETKRRDKSDGKKCSSLFSVTNCRRRRLRVRKPRPRKTSRTPGPLALTAEEPS